MPARITKKPLTKLFSRPKAARKAPVAHLWVEDLEGRVMSLFGMAFQGAAPFGSLLAGWIGVRAVVTGSGVLVLLGGLIFATQLPRLRRRARPVYTRLGILPEAATGVNAATELTPESRG